MNSKGLLVTSSILLVNLCCLGFPVYSYNYDSHEQLSIKILSESKIGSYLPMIGLKTIRDRLTLYNNDERFADVTKSIEEWLRYGTEQEDAILSFNPARFRNHFYDPISKSGYFYYGLSGEIAPQWALEESQSFVTQEYSLRDASDYFYRALTSSDPERRETYFAKTFESLGHVLHVLQDMTSLPHTRADSHGGYIVFGALSLYETYTETIFQTRRHSNESDKKHKIRQARVSQLLSSQYPKVNFPRAYDWWSTADGKGLADYTNRGFVSEDTNFDDGHYALPQPAGKTTVSIQDLYQKELGEPVPTDVIDGREETLKGEVDFVGSMVEDRYTGQVTYNPRASTYSIFNSDLNRYNVKIDYSMDEHRPSRSKIMEVYTLNRFNFDSAHKFLIPRTVAYGTGLIDHFFRGRLEIRPPEGGIYALVDHAQVNQKEEGFKKVKLKVKNVTLPVSGKPQDIQGGKLVLVAKYHRNLCYEADLSGERKPTGGRWNACYQVDQKEYLNVSKEQTITSLKVQGEAIEQTFEFEQPIPLNVVELEFQVIYRGEMGGEEAVAMGIENISETTYFTWINSTDYFPIDGTFYPPETILGNPHLKKRWKEGGEPALVPTVISLELQEGRMIGQLSPGKCLRIAMLMGESVDLSYWVRYDNYGVQVSGHHVVYAKQDFLDHGHYLSQVRGSIYWHFLHSYILLDIGPRPSSSAVEEMGNLQELDPQSVEINF